MDCCEDPMAMCRVVCPKPRRVGPSNVDGFSMAPLRFHMRNDAESKDGAELLGLILRKDEFQAERCTKLSSSPPFFFGSPPCRTPNPVVQDAHFGVEKLNFIGKAPIDSQQLAHARKQLGKKQATVRVEGFDCDYCGMESVNCT